MLKKMFTFSMLILVICGLGIGVYFSFSPTEGTKEERDKKEAIFGKVQQKPLEVTQFFTYGQFLNFSGNIANISKDNFESVKLYLTDGKDFEKTYELTGVIEDGKLNVSTTSQMNSGLKLDSLNSGEYVILVRVKSNNSVNPKFYSLANSSQYPDIDYFTITKDGKNNKVSIGFKNTTYNEHEYSYMSINVSENEKNDAVYDIVLDAGHGGKDTGEHLGADTEANITLSYVKRLKQKLEEKGLKVKLTRDDSNTETFTATNMYDENGRISIACSSKAKYMLSLHLNNGNAGLKGLEIYSPGKSDLNFAQNMASKIVESTDIEYSNNNSFKVAEGVYVRNFTQSIIKDYEATAKRKGYEPYNLNLDTPYLYTIREVGGIATNAFADGRNKAYSANKYYNSNQGIECYQIEMGYIKKDLEIIKNQMEQYVNAISEAVLENL